MHEKILLTKAIPNKIAIARLYKSDTTGLDIKEQLKWLRFDQIEELRAAVQKELNKLTLKVITSLTGWKFILEALSVAGL